MKIMKVIFTIYINGKQMLCRNMSSMIPANFAQLNTRANILMYYFKALQIEVLKNSEGIQVGNYYVTVTCDGVINDLVDVYGVVPATSEEMDGILEQCHVYDSLFRIVANYALAHKKE